jgi:hypothetical protein
MKLRYFVIDRLGRLLKITRSRINALWRGDLGIEELGEFAPNEVRLVSVLCDRRLLPKKVFLLRLPLTQGQFTKANYLTLRIFSMPDCVTPKEVVTHHTDGWPRDFFTQLAVALDVPRRMLDVPLGIGGPLLMAAALKVTPKQALRYLR